MSNANNNIPTAPGWWYRMGSNSLVECVLVEDGYSLFYLSTYRDGDTRVEDDGLWLSPVPMPDKWAPRELFDELLYMLSAINPAPGTPADDVLMDARAWSKANPAPEALK